MGVGYHLQGHGRRWFGEPGARDAAVARGEGEEYVAAPFVEATPIRPRPMLARIASRSHWVGRSGASVARTTIIEPVPAGWAPSSKGEGMISVPSTRPTGAPSTRSTERLP